MSYRVRGQEPQRRNICPATTMVGTSSLVHPDMLVELDVDAVL